MKYKGLLILILVYISLIGGTNSLFADGVTQKQIIISKFELKKITDGNKYINFIDSLILKKSKNKESTKLLLSKLNNTINILEHNNKISHTEKKILKIFKYASAIILHENNDLDYCYGLKKDYISESSSNFYYYKNTKDLGQIDENTINYEYNVQHELFQKNCTNGISKIIFENTSKKYINVGHDSIYSKIKIYGEYNGKLLFEITEGNGYIYNQGNILTTYSQISNITSTDEGIYYIANLGYNYHGTKLMFIDNNNKNHTILTDNGDELGWNFNEMPKGYFILQSYKHTGFKEIQLTLLVNNEKINPKTGDKLKIIEKIISFNK